MASAAAKKKSRQRTHRYTSNVFSMFSQAQIHEFKVILFDFIFIEIFLALNITWLTDTSAHYFIIILYKPNDEFGLPHVDWEISS